MSAKMTIPMLKLDDVPRMEEPLPQTDDQARQCAYEYFELIFKGRLVNGRNHFFPHVIELLEKGETELAVLTLSEILRGPRFLTQSEYWCKRITFWMESKLEFDPNAFGNAKLLPYRVFYILTREIAYDEDYLRNFLDPVMMK
jgi:hypothetical protein